MQIKAYNKIYAGIFEIIIAFETYFQLEIDKQINNFNSIWWGFVWEFQRKGKFTFFVFVLKFIRKFLKIGNFFFKK